MLSRKRLSALLLLALIALLAVGCGRNRGAGGDETLTVLAGSELKDIEPLLDRIERNTGVRIEFEYIGTLDGVEQLASGLDVDAAWFSHGKYITLLEETRDRVITQEKIMLSPVVLGVKEDRAREWGWIDSPDLTWRDIAERAAAGDLRFAMTNPASSNSGFTALVGVAAALSGSDDALSMDDIADLDLRDFFRGQVLTAGSSGWLADQYVEEQEQLDGMVNYESVLLGLNEGRDLNEPLHLVYPSEGIITADYPIMLINGDKREAFDRLVEYLRSTEMQEELMTETLRRPAVPGIKLTNDFPDQLLVELPFPDSSEVIDALVFSYLDEQRLPTHAIFVLDVSGSMEGNRLRDLKTAMLGLTGEDESITGQFARFRDREIVTIIPFSDNVQDVRDFAIANAGGNSGGVVEVRNYVDDLRANGGTAVYSALQRAYELATAAQSGDPNRIYSIVLMSDGESNEGISSRQFERFYNSLPNDAQQIRTFTILFGNADEDAMESIAEETGGRMFNARSDALSFVFKQIRGYQ